MGTNCAPLVDDLFLFCYERDFMLSLSDDTVMYKIIFVINIIIYMFLQHSNVL